MRRLALLAVLMAMVAFRSADACTLVPYRAADFSRIAKTVASDLYKHATYVDIVTASDVKFVDRRSYLAAEEAEEIGLASSEAERAEIREYYEWARGNLASHMATVSYRVDEHLKGNSPDFALSAFILPTWHRPSAEDQVRELAKRGDFSQPRLHWGLSIVEAKNWGGLGMCSSPITAVEGARYLVFRGADGGLLDEPGPVYEQLMPELDPWLERLRRTARR